MSFLESMVSTTPRTIPVVSLIVFHKNPSNLLF